MAIDSLEKLYDTFELIDDWEERYRVIIDMAKDLPTMSDDLKTEETKVRGCISQVWMVAKQTDSDPPTFEFIADSDAHIVKGLIAILLLTYSGKTSSDILATDIKDVFNRLNLEEHLSPNRRNGFYSMVERIKMTAQSPERFVVD